MPGDLIHDSADNLTKYLEKQNKYAAISADKALASGGKRNLILKMLFSPLVRFVKFYIVRLGFLDGLAGFVHISIGCFYSFIKYAKMAGKSSG